MLALADRINGWIKGQFVVLLLAVAAVTVLVPPLGLALKDAEVVPMPAGFAIDLPSLGLAFMMLSASIGCRFTDFRHLVDWPRGPILCLSVYYVLGPLVCGLAGFFVARFFGGEESLQLQIGIMLTMVTPIARTSAIWVQRTTGNMAFLLAVITLTTGLGVLTLPLYLEAITDDVTIPVGSIVAVFVISVLIPMLLGMSLRHLAPAVADRWKPLFSLLGTVGLWIAVAANAAVAGPHLGAHGPLLIAMATLTVAVNLALYGMGIALARATGVFQEDAIAIIFGSGMRSNGTSLVIGLKAFPHLPLATFPSAVYILSQHIIASWLARSMNRLDGGIVGPAVGASRAALESRLATVLSEQGRRQPQHRLAVFHLAGVEQARSSREAVVGRLRRRLRGTDYVSLVDDEMFAVVLPHTSDLGARVVVDKLTHTTAQAFPEVRLGWMVVPVAGRDAPDLVDRGIAGAREVSSQTDREPLVGAAGAATG